MIESKFSNYEIKGTTLYQQLSVLRHSTWIQIITVEEWLAVSSYIPTDGMWFRPFTISGLSPAVTQMASLRHLIRSAKHINVLRRKSNEISEIGPICSVSH
jgi:hypothetical protein